MQNPFKNYRTLLLGALALLTLAAFIYVVMRSGPLAPVPVTAITVQSEQLQPQLFGIGTVEARYSYLIGPLAAGRVKTVSVQVGDRVHAGQVVAELDPIDLDSRISAQAASLKRAESLVLASDAQLHEADARNKYAKAQASRYEELVLTGAVSKETAENKVQDYQITQSAYLASKANLTAASQELQRIKAELSSLRTQRDNLLLRAPAEGVVTAREVDPGSTAVAGQTVVEVIDPNGIWLNIRFDQTNIAPLKAGQKALIILRSRPDQRLSGKLLRIEPKADAITEETLAKVLFETIPAPLPPIGEIAEVTVLLPALAAAPVVPNSAIKRSKGKLGVWLLKGGKPHFAPIKTGSSDLAGKVQILEGVQSGDRVIVYSRQSLDGSRKVRVVDHIPGTQP